MADASKTPSGLNGQRNIINTFSFGSDPANKSETAATTRGPAPNFTPAHQNGFPQTALLPVGRPQPLPGLLLKPQAKKQSTRRNRPRSHSGSETSGSSFTSDPKDLAALSSSNGSNRTDTTDMEKRVAANQGQQLMNTRKIKSLQRENGELGEQIDSDETRLDIRQKAKNLDAEARSNQREQKKVQAKIMYDSQQTKNAEKLQQKESNRQSRQKLKAFKKQLKADTKNPENPTSNHNSPPGEQ